MEFHLGSRLSRRIVAATVIALSFGVAAVVSAGSASASVPYDSHGRGMLVFTRGGGIWTISPDGSSLTRLATDPAVDRSPAAEYSAAVTRICAGALLFDNAHKMGTRADALSVARDIRASTARRLARVTALPVPPEFQRSSSRWISSQRRLAALYARTWVRIYDTIDAANTQAQRETLAERLDKLVHAPDQLKLAAGRLDLELHVPDCTGGGR